jgi:L-lysine 2,3-aminomutase
VEIDEVRPWPAGAWQQLLAAVITRSDELTELAGGPPAAGGGPSAAAAERQFGVRVPRAFAKRIRPADRSDPILRQLLLAGVNDSVEALCELSERLFEAGALPYYLHLLDRVRGAAHFEVPEAEALRLIAGVRDRMPGYLVPRLVREVAGAPSKVAVELRDEG